MNPLTALVFILALLSTHCFDADISVEEVCMKEVGITKRDRENFEENEMNVKCYYHCVLEYYGVIVNGAYVGNERWCRNVKDANKCELGWKVRQCSVFRSKV